MNTDLTASLVYLLSNNDTQTIIQCVRLLEVLLHHSPDPEKQSLVLNHPSLLEKIAFILQNSLNGKKKKKKKKKFFRFHHFYTITMFVYFTEELLCGTLKLLSSIVNHLESNVQCPCEGKNHSFALNMVNVCCRNIF